MLLIVHILFPGTFFFIPQAHSLHPWPSVLHRFFYNWKFLFDSYSKYYFFLEIFLAQSKLRPLFNHYYPHDTGLNPRSGGCTGMGPQEMTKGREAGLQKRQMEYNLKTMMFQRNFRKGGDCSCSRILQSLRTATKYSLGTLESCLVDQVKTQAI